MMFTPGVAWRHPLSLNSIKAVRSTVTLPANFTLQEMVNYISSATTFPVSMMHLLVEKEVVRKNDGRVRGSSCATLCSYRQQWQLFVSGFGGGRPNLALRNLCERNL